MHNNPTTLRARELRNSANPAEQALWSVLKGKQLGGYKFTRQFPIGPYFADFACRTKFLLIELDGGQHVDSIYDAGRDGYLVGEGYSVLRFPSVTVLQNRYGVCETILAVLDGRIDGNVDASDMKFMKSSAVPRRFTRHRPWGPNPPLAPPFQGGE